MEQWHNNLNESEQVAVSPSEVYDFCDWDTKFNNFTVIIQAKSS